MFAVNVDTKDIHWTSDILGHLGTGNHITLFLPEGLHKITAEIQNTKKEKNVYVYPVDNTGTQTMLVNYSPLEMKLKAGAYYSYLVSNEGNIGNFQVSITQASAGRAVSVYSKQALPALHRDIQLSMPMTRECIKKQPVTKNARKKKASYF